MNAEDSQTCQYENGYLKDMTVNGSAMSSEYPTHSPHNRPNQENFLPERTVNGSTMFTEYPVKGPNPENFLPVPKLRFSTAAAVVFAVSVLCFCVSYDGEFVYDDKRAIVYNKDLLPETHLSDLLIHDFWGEDLLSETSHKSYRPLTVLSFRLNYFLGGLNPVWYHIPNILLHGVVSVLLLRVFSLMFGGYEVNPESGAVRFKAPKSALLCTLLFAVHPIHTESVSGIVGRADLLCAMSFLVSFLLYVKSCAYDLQDADDNKLISYRPSSFSVSCMSGSMLMCFLSVLCKEHGITVLGICSAYDIILVCAVDFRQMVSLKITERPDSYPIKNEYEIPQDKNSEVEKEELNKLSDHEVSQSRILVSPWVLSVAQRHVFLVITGWLIMVVRWLVMGSTLPAFVEYNIPHSYQNGTLIRALNYNYLYSINAWLLVNPWWLCFDWSMGCVPVIKSFSDARIICSVAVWIVIGALLTTCLKAPVTRDKRVLTMAIAFIIVPFLPASNVFFRVGFVVAERVLYLPSIGFCMVVVIGIRQIGTAYPRHVQTMKYGMYCLVCVFVLRCIQRSSQWRVEMELYKSAEKVCPLNAKIHFYLAMVNGDKGNTDYAIEKYRRGLGV